MAMQALEQPETPCKYAEEAEMVFHQPFMKKGRICSLLKRKQICYNWNKPEAVATCQVRKDHEMNQNDL